MKLNIWISDSGSSARFSVETQTGAVTVHDDGCMPVKKLVRRVKSWAGKPSEIKARVERAWNHDCESYEAEITDDEGNVLA